MLALLGVGTAVAAVGSDVLLAPPAAAAVAWNYPFVSEALITDRFNEIRYCNCSSPHIGLDLAPARGTVIHSIAAGVVTSTPRDSGGLGHHVTMDHADGFQSRYGHMIEGSHLVQPGQTIGASTPLGLVGESGAAYGDHLHLETLHNGVRFDPLTVIGGAPFAGSPGIVYLTEDKDHEMKLIQVSEKYGTVGAGFACLIGHKSLKHLNQGQLDTLIACGYQRYWLTGQQFMYMLQAHSIPSGTPAPGVDYDGN